MPYRIEVRKEESKPYKIVRERDGKVVGSSETMKDAQASIRARMMAEYGKK